MSSILSHISDSDIPSIVVGDFHEDILNVPDSRILSLMSHYGFSQLVQAPTTDRGTLIDHVHCKK